MLKENKKEKKTFCPPPPSQTRKSRTRLKQKISNDFHNTNILPEKGDDTASISLKENKNRRDF